MTSPFKLALTGAAFASVLALGARAQAAPQPLSIAIVVGSNHSPSANVESLRYGDDDAVLNARTLALLGAQTTLLVAPDAETHELFPNTHPQGPATRAALRAAFDGAKATLAAAHASGRPTELYFLFAGHGDMADGRPFLQLDDARLWREDLADMLREAGADENHVLVDACYAASFVSDRGPGGDREELPPGFSRTQVTWPKRTGFLTARSAGGQTHEWAEYQSGVFSHELRSGLMGAADVNVDGKVTYREIAAFVRRANEAIPNRRYRPEVSTMPPAGDLDATLATLPAGPMVLEMDVSSTGRSYVETETGIRLVDMHAGLGAPIRLRLPTDLGNLFVEEVDGASNEPTREFRFTPHAGQILLSALTPETTTLRARGAGHEAFLHLFARPFDAAAVTSFELDDTDAAELAWEQKVDDARNQRTFRRKLALGALGLGVATAAVGTGFLWSGYELDQRLKIKSGPGVVNQIDVPGIQSTASQRKVIGGVMLGVAGGSLLSSALLYFWPAAPSLSVASTPGCEACLAYQRSF